MTVDFAQVHASEVHLVILPSLVRVSNLGHVARAVESRVIVLVKYVYGIGKMGGLRHLDQALVSLLHASPSCRDDSP